MSLRYNNDMKNYNHITLDIETMGVKPDTKVLSIAAVAFDPFEITSDFSQNPKLDLLVNIDEQENRTIDEETIWWWSQREQSVRDKIFGEKNRVSVADALDLLIKFCWQKSTVWCQGPTLDITVLTHLFEEHNKGVPWKYNVVRDSRTLLSLVEIEDEPEATHDAIQDCYRQCRMTQRAIKKLGISKFAK